MATDHGFPVNLLNSSASDRPASACCAQYSAASGSHTHWVDAQCSLQQLLQQLLRCCPSLGMLMEACHPQQSTATARNETLIFLKIAKVIETGSADLYIGNTNREGHHLHWRPFTCWARVPQHWYSHLFPHRQVTALVLTLVPSQSGRWDPNIKAQSTCL